MTVFMEVAEQQKTNTNKNDDRGQARTEMERLIFDARQAQIIETSAVEIATLGGPQASGAKMKAAYCAREIAVTLDEKQSAVARRFADGDLALLVFEGLHGVPNDAVPDELPALNELEKDFDCIRLASRNQILLEIVSHRAFAYDIDNNGQITRLVGNFKGGGEKKIENEPEPTKIELSSHAGLALGPHTEAPYHASVKSSGDHSPAPSALILTARWNPLNEPTTVIPMYEVIKKLGAHHALALTSKSFKFTRSDSFVSGKGEEGAGVSILDFDDKGAFALRYNSYRFSVCDDAPAAVKSAFQQLTEEVGRAEMLRVPLQPDNAIVINNCQALHCRDVIKDNRRLLVRLFGYSRDAQPIVLSDDPLLVQG